MCYIIQCSENVEEFVLHDASGSCAALGSMVASPRKSGGHKVHPEKKDGAEPLARLQEALAALGPGPLRCSDGGRLARALQPFRDGVGAS